MNAATNSMVEMTRSRRTIAIFIAVLVTGLILLIYANYQRDIRQALKRVMAGSQIIDTPCGPIEYAIAGDGDPVLIAHGAGGGYDEGLDLTRDLTQRGFRVVAVSRFGYLRTPLPADASPAAQADAYACLLDALNIPRAAVVGISAGAPSSMQFALRHPERTTALVLLVPAAYPMSLDQGKGGAVPEQTSILEKSLMEAAFKSDFLFWAAPRLAPRVVDQVLIGTPPDLIATASADERARVVETLDHLLPFSARRIGILNDAKNQNPLPRYDLERIAAPTLVIDSTDDGYGTYPGAQYSAQHIPHARFIGYPTGGHLLVGHFEAALAEIASFVQSHSR